MSAFALRQLCILAAPVYLGMLVLCGIGLVFMALSVGMSPIEVVSVFLHEVALALPNALIYLILLGFLLAAIAGFGRWCLSQADSCDHKSLYRFLHCISFASISWVANNSAHRVSLAMTSILQYLRSHSRIGVSTSADLSGAAPLLN